MFAKIQIRLVKPYQNKVCKYFYFIATCLHVAVSTVETFQLIKARRYLEMIQKFEFVTNNEILRKLIGIQKTADLSECRNTATQKMFHQKK